MLYVCLLAMCVSSVCFRVLILDFNDLLKRLHTRTHFTVLVSMTLCARTQPVPVLLSSGAPPQGGNGLKRRRCAESVFSKCVLRSLHAIAVVLVTFGA